MCVCTRVKRQSLTRLKCPNSDTISLSLASPSALFLTPYSSSHSSSSVSIGSPRSASVLTPPFLCSSSHGHVFSIPPTLPWAETCAAWLERETPFPLRNKHPLVKSGPRWTCEPRYRLSSSFVMHVFWRTWWGGKGRADPIRDMWRKRGISFKRSDWVEILSMPWHISEAFILAPSSHMHNHPADLQLGSGGENSGWSATSLTLSADK